MVAARGAAARRGALLVLLAALGFFRLRLARAGEYLFVPPTLVSVSSPFPHGCSCPLPRRTLVRLPTSSPPLFPFPRGISIRGCSWFFGWKQGRRCPRHKAARGFLTPCGAPRGRAAPPRHSPARCCRQRWQRRRVGPQQLFGGAGGTHKCGSWSGKGAHSHGSGPHEAPLLVGKNENNIKKHQSEEKHKGVAATEPSRGAAGG